jgi:hypothetical protein
MIHFDYCSALVNGACSCEPPEPAPIRQTVTRVYDGPKARTCHFLPVLASPNSDDMALCGTEPEALMWHGTGNQEEIDKASRMTVCRECKRVHLRVIEARREES